MGPLGEVQSQSAPNGRCREVLYASDYTDLPIEEHVYVGALDGTMGTCTAGGSRPRGNVTQGDCGLRPGNGRDRQRHRLARRAIARHLRRVRAPLGADQAERRRGHALHVAVGPGRLRPRAAGSPVFDRPHADVYRRDRGGTSERRIATRTRMRTDWVAQSSRSTRRTRAPETGGVDRGRP